MCSKSLLLLHYSCCWFVGMAVSITTLNASVDANQETAHDTGGVPTIPMCPPSDGMPQELPTSEFCSVRGPLFWSFEAFVSHLDEAHFCSYSNLSSMMLCDFANFQEDCGVIGKHDGDIYSLPAKRSTQGSIDYVCNFHSRINWVCVTNQLSRVRQCVRRDVNERRRGLWGSQATDADDDCKLVLTFTLCLWEILAEACGESSASIMVGAINSFLKPQKCYLAQELQGPTPSSGQKTVSDESLAFMTMLATLLSHLVTFN